MKRASCPLVLGASLLGAAALVSGCTLGPNYQRPSLTTPQAWRDTGAPAPVEDVATLANTPWWKLFQDPKLQALIEIALRENQDLRVAIERIVEARARVGYTRADLFPKLDAGVGASYFEQSREGFPSIPKPGDNDSALYQLSADVSWELDLFGRIRRATEAERALLLATEEGRRAVAISLVASVARSYVELRDFDLQLEIARRTLVSRAKSLELAQVRFRGGLTGEKDSRQAEAEYRRIEVSVLDFERQVRQKENELSVLIGRGPGEVVRGRTLPDLPVALQVPAGLPSGLLDRRPDLLAAEQHLHATTADVGAAKAMLFPRIALTAGYGTTSTELDALFTGPAQAWSVAAGVLQPVFNAGKNRRRVEIAQSQMRQSLYEYEKTVLQALREVEDGLVAWRKTGLQRTAQRARVEAERKVLQLSEVRYEGGVADYLEVLDAQRSLFSAELDEVQTIAAQMVSLVQLYKALGGGWPNAPEVSQAAAAPTPTPEVVQ
ncbi:MAG: efflux transporter outer membrane subunit [Deltaproteobacteria bacterium]|nr:efflux transporter outer membrane subunit [Deltaproteobacteria bacterium]